jgi:hypothetical protein
MADVTFHTAWRKSDPDLVRDAKAFWHGIGVVMTPEETEQRASELCALAYADGKVAAVSTASPYFYPLLRTRFAYYRTMVAPEFRQQVLASRLCVYSRDLLETWSREHPEEGLMGLFIVLQAEEFIKGRRHTPITMQLSLQMVLVGLTREGHHMRIVWFDNATVE